MEEDDSNMPSPSLFCYIRTLPVRRRTATMATLTFRDENRVLEDPAEISRFLEGLGLWYRRFEGSDDLPENAADPEILDAYREPIRQLMAEGGYATADVINIKPDIPGLEAMLNRFNR